MKRTIWKYTLDIVDEQSIKMPQYSTLLSVAMRGNDLCLWAVVEPEREGDMGVARILIFGTGNSVYFGKLPFLGTVQERSFVWHVFGGMIK